MRRATRPGNGESNVTEPATQNRRAILTSLGLGAAAFASTVAKRAVACTPPTPVSATITVACVTDYLDPPSITTVAAAAQAAADAIECDGGILYFPEGLHEIDTPVVIPSKVWVLGAGAGTILQRAGSAGCVLQAEDVTGVRISNLAFDVNADDEDGACGIELLGVNSDIMIEQCLFFTSTEIDPPNYACAINANNLSRSHIRENLSQGLAIICAGSTGPGVHIQSNHSVSAFDYGIGVLLTTDTDSATQLIIDGNLIESPGSTGIIVGGRNESTLGETIAAIFVSNNTVTGTLPGPGIGILVRPAEDTRDVLIKSNIVSDITGEVASNSIGIGCVSGESGSLTRGLLIHGNSVRETDLAGILVLGSVAGATVSGNMLDATRGVQCISTEDGIGQVLVVNNIITNSAVQGVLLDATYQSISQATVSANQISNSYGYGCAGLRLVAGEELYLEAEVRANRFMETQTSPTNALAVVETSIENGSFDSRYFNNVMSAPATVPATLSATAVAVDNPGLVTDARGTATIPAPSSSVPVSLASILSLPLDNVSQISATLIEIPSNWKTPYSGQFWVEWDSSTQFSVHCDPAPATAESVEVAWRVTVRSA